MTREVLSTTLSTLSTEQLNVPFTETVILQLRVDGTKTAQCTIFQYTGTKREKVLRKIWVLP